MSSTEPTQPDEREQRLRRYLRERSHSGEFYFKSKFITEEVGMSTKEIGALMQRLSQSQTEFEVHKWAYSSATTWRIVPCR